MANILRKTKLYFKTPDTKLSYNISSIMQGVLMDKVSYGFGEKMHQNGIKPYSQYFSYEDDIPVWTINTLNEEAESELVQPLLDEGCQKIYLRQKNLTLEIIKKEHQEVSYDALMQDTFFSSCSRYITLKFKTPTSFKTNNQYQFYPTTEHILKSLVNKFNACGFDAELDYFEDMEEALQHMQIVNYSLHSTQFCLEHTKIPSFMGRITLKITGPQQFVNLMHLLIRIGEYAGIGIKTAMGMGAVEITERKEK